MVLENQHKEEDYASFHFQNTLVDYHIKILPPPPQNTELEKGVSFNYQIRYLDLKDISRVMWILGFSFMEFPPLPGYGPRQGLCSNCPDGGPGTSSSTTFLVVSVSSLHGLLS